LKLLLDSHALIWSADSPERLPRAVRDQLTDPKVEVLFSVVSLWELTIKRRAGKLDVDVDQLVLLAGLEGFTWLPIAVAHLEGLNRLPPVPGHRDPFDHLLIAQAIVEQAIIVTADRRFHDYPVRLLAL
jgi:PIN domain nuclease of toxin-antitoxin system